MSAGCPAARCSALAVALPAVAASCVHALRGIRVLASTDAMRRHRSPSWIPASESVKPEMQLVPAVLEPPGRAWRPRCLAHSPSRRSRSGARATASGRRRLRWRRPVHHPAAWAQALVRCPRRNPRPGIARQRRRPKLGFRRASRDRPRPHALEPLHRGCPANAELLGADQCHCAGLRRRRATTRTQAARYACAPAHDSPAGVGLAREEL